MDLLMSAEMLVPDATRALATMVGSVGIPEPRPSWHQLWDGWGFEAYWCRVTDDLAQSPTRLEIIAPHGTPDPALEHPHMQAIFDAQGDRPAKMHSTPISVPDVSALAERLAARGARFRLDEPTDELPFLRLWMGLTAEDPVDYVPTSDAGLRLEFVPTSGLMLPAGCDDPDPAPVGGPDGGFTGVAARIFVTNDVAATIRCLEGTFDWSPSGVSDDGGERRAAFSFGFARSAVIEVVEPGSDTIEGEFLARWGPGPFGIRLAVNGLDAKLADLDRRGTRSEVTDRAGQRVIRIDPAATTGTHVELVEHADGPPRAAS